MENQGQSGQVQLRLEKLLVTRGEWIFGKVLKTQFCGPRKLQEAHRNIPHLPANIKKQNLTIQRGN
jgi:hypothetical protein